MKEPEIKLFGRKIVLPESGGVESADGTTSGSGGCGGEDSDGCGGGAGEVEKSDDEDQLCETKQQEKEQQNNPSDQTQEREEDTVSEDHPTDENEQSDPTDGQQKTLKKPDKILPCPRCNSMETKFCYYNNYNISQPRHFCKSCQRYWTAGGTMRNVPVGAGRRKNKNSAPHCHHITISDNALQSSSRGVDGFHHHPAFKPNATVLSFGPDRPVFEPSISGSNISEKRAVKMGEDSPIGSSDGGKKDPQKPVIHNMNGIPYPVPCITGVHWPFPWNSPVQLPPLYPVPFYPPPPYWGCCGPPGWNIPWLSADQMGASPQPDSPLGKHSRNGELIRSNGFTEGRDRTGQRGSENSIVVPKTLRMDDPEEAAKSSIWETLGIEYDSISREGLFKALQPKGGEKKLVGPASSLAMQANPAALSRSITFQEGA